MLALSFPSLFKHSWFSRRNIIAACIVLGLPILFIGLARLIAMDPVDRDKMEVARAVLEEHVRRHPPNKTWQMTSIRISDDFKLVMDVNVPNSRHAKVIQSRTPRVQHSYMKLACPSLDSRVYKQLPEGETVWIQLHYYDQPIIKGACPLAPSIF